MTVCERCREDMQTVHGCTGATVVLADIGKRERGNFERVRRGDEPLWAKLGEIPDGPCGDCGVEFGELHHIRCLKERCPRCGDQASFCVCTRIFISNSRDTK